MFAKIVGRRATALATTLAVVVGLAITPALAATADDGIEPPIVESTAEQAAALPEAPVVEAPAETESVGDEPHGEDARPPAPALPSRASGQSMAPMGAPPAPAQPEIYTDTLPDATVGQAYSVTLDTTDLDSAPGQNDFSVTSGTLPPGLALDRRSGTISGTATGSLQRYDFTVMLSVRRVDSEPRALSITVSAPAPVVTTAALPAATVGAAYPATQLTASGTGVITWSATGLPAGLLLDSATGIITGSPSYNPTYGASATVPVTVVASNGRDSAPQSLSIVVNTPAPLFGAQRLPAATVGVQYNQVLPLSNPYGDLTFALIGAATLPSGLELTPDGRIFGTPDYDPEAGARKAITVPVRVSGTAGSSEQTFRFALLTPAPEITTTTLPDGWWGQAYSQPIAATGPGVEFTLTGLPDNLYVDGSTITGTPVVTGTFLVQITATNTADFDVEEFYLTINDKPNLVRMPVVKLETGDTFTGVPQFTGEDVVLTLGEDAPAGMKLNQNNRIKWTATAPGTYRFTITATNPAGTDTQKYTVRVFDAPVITQGALDQGVINVDYRQRLEHDGTNVKFTVVRGDLPDGMTLTRKGVLKGSPTEAGTFSFRVKAQNAVDADHQWFSLTVSAPAMTLSSNSVVRGTSVTVGGTGYLPGDTLSLWLHSTPVLLGTVVATDGTFTSTVVIPADAAPGAHHVVVTGARSGTYSLPITVALPAATPAAPQANQPADQPTSISQPAAADAAEDATFTVADVTETEELEAPAGGAEEPELETLDQPTADSESAPVAATNWSGLVLGAVALLLAALLVLLLLWRRRRSAQG